MNSFFYIYTIFCLFLTSCHPSSKSEHKLDHAQLANRVLYSYSAYLKKEKNIQAVGLGGSMMDDIEVLFFHLETPGEYSVAEARKIYVNVIEELLTKINGDAQIRPFLHNFPFTHKNVVCSHQTSLYRRHIKTHDKNRYWQVT